MWIISTGYTTIYRRKKTAFENIIQSFLKILELLMGHDGYVLYYGTTCEPRLSQLKAVSRVPPGE